MTNAIDILKVEAISPIEKAGQIVQLELISRGINEKIKQYKADLLKITQEQDVYMLKTGKYTISRAKRVTPRVLDFETLKSSLEKAKVPYETQEVFADQMSVVFREAVKQGRKFDGLEAQETEYVSIRITKK